MLRKSVGFLDEWRIVGTSTTDCVSGKTFSYDDLDGIEIDLEEK